MKKLFKKAVAMLFAAGIILNIGIYAYAEPAEDQSLVPTPIAAEQAEVLAEEVQDTKESGKMSTVGVILMFFLAIVVNAGISFWISNRFYRMSKRDTHLMSEIRALRRDLDDKLSGNVKEIKESAAVIKNSNKSYANNGEIVHKNEPPTDEIAEIAKKWNIAIERDEEPEVKIRQTKKLQTRDDVKPKKEPKRSESQSPIKNRAKEILGDIFPFNDEE